MPVGPGLSNRRFPEQQYVFAPFFFYDPFFNPDFCLQRSWAIDVCRNVVGLSVRKFNRNGRPAFDDMGFPVVGTDFAPKMAGSLNFDRRCS
jgi:hypothetical protein